VARDMYILALDLAITTGYACKAPWGSESGVQKFELRHGESPGMRWIRFRKWIQELCQDRLLGQGNCFDIIVYEQPIVGQQRSSDAANIAFNLSGKVQEFVAEYGGECVPVPIATLKKWATGRGNAGKPEMVAEAQRRHPEIEIINHDHADALLLLDYAYAELVPVAGRSE